jgi:hypothetical protein
VNLSGTSVATLAMLFVSLLLAVLVMTSVDPGHVPPPRREVRAEHRTRPAPEPTAEPASEKPEPKTETAPPEAPEQPASPTASEPAPLAPPVETPAPEPVAPPVQTGGAPAAAETGEAPAPRGIAAPTAQAAVTGFYAALDDRRFKAAWDALSPAVRTTFGGFEGWRAGYSETISSRPTGFRVTEDGEATVVEHLLTAEDRASCGPVTQRFDVTWRLIEVDGAWLAESLTAKKRSGPAPATACA